jgi:hypothetical protein
MEHSPSSEADSFSVSQEIPRPSDSRKQEESFSSPLFIIHHHDLFPPPPLNCWADLRINRQ